MPGGDRTGPAGSGPRTGRATGLCAGSGVPGFFSSVGRAFGFAGGRGRGAGRRAGAGGGAMFGAGNRGFGGGFGRGVGGGFRGGSGGFGGGFGGGRGWRHWFHATGLPGWSRTDAGPWAAAAATPEDEREFLESQARAIETELGHIRERLGDLAAQDEPKG
jgi:hypothetical protein